jgi:hypothetical protein
MVARARAAREVPRDQDSCARGDIVVDDTMQHLICRIGLVRNYGFSFPPLFSPYRIQPRRIDSRFILILDFFRPELQERQSSIHSIKNFWIELELET